jgi:hypothetical protein
MIMYYANNNANPARIAAYVYGDMRLWPLVTKAYGSETDIVPYGTKLELAEPQTDTKYHTVTAGDNYTMIAQFYYQCEHFAAFLKNANSDLELADNVGAKIIIPALLDKALYVEAKKWY